MGGSIFKTLVAIAGGIEAVPILKSAKALGLKVILVDGDDSCPGRHLSDMFWHIDTYDAKAIFRACLDYSIKHGPINGVMAMSADVPYSVATVANGLNLPGIDLKAALIATDKLLMKECLKRKGVPVPKFIAVRNLRDLKNAATKLGSPFVLKPVDSRGARGVLLMTPEIDLPWAFKHAISFSSSKLLIAEEFLDGPQVSTESIVFNEKFFHLGFSDRNYEFLKRFSPHIIENGGELPTCLSYEEKKEICDLVEKAANVLGFTYGTVKGDIVYTNKGPYIIELAPRLSGGYFASHEIPLNTGVDFVRAAIKLAIGELPLQNELVPRQNKALVQRYFFPPPGKIKRIEGLDKIKEIPWVKLFKLHYKPGDVISNYTAHVNRGGVFIVEGKDREEAMKRAKTIYNTIKWNMEPAKS